MRGRGRGRSARQELSFGRGGSYGGLHRGRGRGSSSSAANMRKGSTSSYEGENQYLSDIEEGFSTPRHVDHSKTPSAPRKAMNGGEFYTNEAKKGIIEAQEKEIASLKEKVSSLSSKSELDSISIRKSNDIVSKNRKL